MSTDFSSIDRLVEFGLGMGLAQQMINTMNHTMNTVQIAGVNAGTTSTLQQPAAPPQSTWYVIVNEHQAGPLTEQEISKLIANNVINGKTLMWTAGMNAWQFAEEIPQINKLFLINNI